MCGIAMFSPFLPGFSMATPVSPTDPELIMMLSGAPSAKRVCVCVSFDGLGTFLVFISCLHTIFAGDRHQIPEKPLGTKQSR